MVTESLKKIVFCLNCVSAIAALVAGGLWFWSTRVEVEYVEPAPVDGWTAGSVTIVKDGKQIDPFATGVEQARWNRWAALAASVAAICQGIATLLGNATGDTDQ